MVFTITVIYVYAGRRVSNLGFHISFICVFAFAYWDFYDAAGKTNRSTAQHPYFALVFFLDSLLIHVGRPV
ncbi:hypothetical protein V8C34DRAFT_283916, partial [Trichoderma compactum]